MAIRSGRFSFTRTNDATSKQTIIQGKKGGSLFRILNSGDIAFKVLVNDSEVAFLNPSYSIDLAGGTPVEIEALNDNDKVQGIYEYLTTSREVRSGRFNTQNPRKDLTKTAPLMVVDLTNSNDDIYFRFFNSGFSNLGIYITKNDDPPSANVQATSDSEFLLRPDQSIDLEVSNKAIWVKSQDAEAIEGIYDFIDSDD